jgi:chromosome segregation ATPase
MDIAQLAKIVEWMDEERRRDKATIVTLEQRLAQQQEFIDTMNRRVNGMESEQSALKEAAMPAIREQQIKDDIRGEIQRLIEASETRRLNAERETERRLRLENDNLTRQITDLDERIKSALADTRSVNELKEERDSFRRSLQELALKLEDLNKRSEEPDRRIASLEELRRQDARRIAESETEVPLLKKTLGELRPKLSLVEELALRNERRVQETQNTERDRREQIQQFIDQQTLNDQQRDQRVESILKRVDSQEKAFLAQTATFESWEQTYREMKRSVEDYTRISERLDRRINEVADSQRLSEERFRTEWNTQREEDQKRWKQFTLSNDEVWRKHEKDFEALSKRLEALSERFPLLTDSIERLWKLERERAQLYRERYQTMLMEHDLQSAAPAVPAGSPTPDAAPDVLADPPDRG